MEQESSDVSAAIEPKVCPSGHLLHSADEVCTECFNKILSTVPNKLVGIGLISGIITIGIALAVGLLPLAEGPLMVPIGLFILGFCILVLGIAKATLFRLTVPHLAEIPKFERKEAYSRSLICGTCGSPMLGGECHRCYRRSRVRVDAIGFCWIPAALAGLCTTLICASLGESWVVIPVVFNIIAPYFSFARSLDRKLPKFPKDTLSR